MSSPDRLWSNIRRTIQTRVGDALVTSSGNVPVYHDYAYGDPDNMRRLGAEQPRWIETAFLTQRAGRQGFALWQIDLFSRIGEEGGNLADPFGFHLDEMGEKLLDIFQGVDAGGLQKGKFHVKDYADPLAPTATSMCIFCQSAGGQIGEPDDVRRLNFSQDFRRDTISLRFLLVQDAAGGAAFYL